MFWKNVQTIAGATVHDEAKGKADIAALSKDGRAHLSHVIRNGIMRITAAYKLSSCSCGRNPHLAEVIKQCEKEMREMGI